MAAMDGGDSAVSRVLVIGAEAETRQNVLNALLQLCGQEAVSDASQGVQELTLKTKYYTAELEVHVHAVETNELLTPLAHDADQYEALVWVVDAASDSSFLETEQFVGNSIEELEFDVSLVVGTRAASASLVQLKRLEQWAQDNGFEFVAVDEDKEKRETQDEDPLHEKRGMARVKEALECNMWASLKTLDKSALAGTASAVSTAHANQAAAAVVEDGDATDEQEQLPASKILVLGADLAEQHVVVKALADLSNGVKIDAVGEIVQELKLKTKYYEADVELHLHRVDTNELVTALQHDVEAYEALLWVVDASSDRSFKEVQQFIERSIEELTFEVSLLVATHVDHVSTTQAGALESWCQDNAFEFIGVSATSSSATVVSPTRAAGDHEKQGVERVLEALHCNMWRSMKMLPRETESKSVQPGPDAVDLPSIPAVSVPASPVVPPPAPLASITAPESSSHEARLEASLNALSGAGLMSDDDPDMEVFSGLFSQVQRIRESGAVLSDEDRRRQAERVAMQLWSLLGADDDDDEGDSE